MKKVLLVTYYWPPAGGPGVQRWLKFVKYLPEFDVEPVVFVPENPTYPIIDKSFEEEVPKSAIVIKRPIFEPYKYAQLFSKKDTQTISSGIIEEKEKQSFLQKSLLFIRGNFFIPDARKYWVKPSVKFLEEYLQRENIDTIITTGPPHSLHLIGLALKKELNLKWIADFRDPWTSIGYHHQLKLTTGSQQKHEKLEKEVLTSADQIITTSFTTAEDFKKITSQPISVITNGFEKEENPSIATLDKKFTFAHIGSLLSGRNPENLWQVFVELIEENKAFKEAFELKLIGKVSQQVLDSIEKHKLQPYLNNLGYVPHHEAIAQQRSAQVLLLLEIDSEKTRGIIPGKLFEYLQARRPIIAIGPKEWDVIKILEDVGGGEFFSYRTKNRLKKKILQYFEAFQDQNLVSSAGHIDQFERKNLTKKLVKIL